MAMTNKEYNISVDKYEMWADTCWIDRKPYRNWKLYRKTQYRENRKEDGKESKE